MKVLLIHLSDIHLKNENNSIFKKNVQLAKAIQNNVLEVDCVFAIISGDIAFSGKEQEYNQAMILLDSINSHLTSYTNKKVSWILIAGNHDCDFDNKNKKVRETLIKSILQDGDKAIDNAVIEQCCEIQNNFFDFRSLYQDDQAVLYEDKLLKVIEFKFKNLSITFNCYNTSWISQLPEQPGKMYFPILRYKKAHHIHKSNLVISILHHPFNWYEPINRRDLLRHIAETSDIVLTGHEHIASKSAQNDLEGNYTEHIEGAVLQETDQDETSGFNIIVFDLDESSQQILNYVWNGDIYLPAKPHDPFPYPKSQKLNKKDFEIHNKFEEFIDDPGASFSHPCKSRITLADIFISPDLRDFKIDRTKENEIQTDIINANALYKIDASQNKIIITGAGKSGKSSLCKVLYKHYHNNGYVPVYIDGRNIKSAAFERFKKVVNESYKEQYRDGNFEKFLQLENDKKIIIIDDFDKAKLNTKYKFLLLETLNKIYNNLIISANDIFRLQEVLSGDRQQDSNLENFRQFEILEFGHLLRNKLISKWTTLGIDQNIEENELTRKIDHTKQIVNTIIGKNFVPSYPLFVLVIMQAIEVGNPHNLKESAYGYYYQFLITQTLSRINKRNDEIDAYYNYITELANHFFENKIRKISKDNLNKFHKRFCDEYKINHHFNELVNSLIDAFIMEMNDDVYKFKYKYVYYFFVARYISNNISQESIRTKVSGMCKRLYREEFANIIMFLTHHSKDPIILEEILSQAKSLFGEFKPIRFDNDISPINKLLIEIPKVILKDKNVNEIRESNLKIKDEVELSEKNTPEDATDEFDLQEDIIELDFISTLNMSFKTIEIIGQVLKNYYGSLKGVTKLALGEEIYFLGLRSLSSFFSSLIDNSDYIINGVKSFIADQNLVEQDRIEESAKEFLFKVCCMISYVFIKKVSEAVGSEKLSETFNEILEKNDITSAHMIDISIKLDFFRAFPHEDISKLSRKLSGNLLPGFLLKQFVITYLYMFPTTYQDKQRICNMLGIPMDSQRIIDTTSAQKKNK